MSNQDKLHPTGLQCLDLLVSSISTAIDSSRQQIGTNADAGETLTRKGRSVCVHQSSSSKAGKNPTTFVDSSTLIELMYKEPQQLSLQLSLYLLQAVSQQQHARLPQLYRTAQPSAHAGYNTTTSALAYE